MLLLLSVQNNFHIILSSYVEGYVKKNLSLNFTSLVRLQASKIWMVFKKITAEFLTHFQAERTP